MKSLLNSLRSGIERKSVTTLATFDTQGGPEWNKFIRSTSFGSGYSIGGLSIDRAFCLTAFLSVIKIISEDVGSLPLFVNRKRGNSADVDTSHPLYRLLHDSPNPDMTALQFREAVTSHALTSGLGLARIERSKFDAGRPIALWPMVPGQVTIDKGRDGRRVFVEQEGNGKSTTYQASQIFQLAGFGMTGYGGIDMLRTLREAIGLGISQQEWANRFFSQAQIPPIVLEHPLSIGEPGVKGVKEAWEEAHKGNKNWHTPAVLQEGMKASLLQYDVSKTQLHENRAFQLLEICRPYRMPPHKLGEMGRATWNNTSAENTRYLNECLRPWLVRWEQGINHWILGKDHPEWYAEHEIGGMLRGDFTQQTEGFRTLSAMGALSINEIRRLLNYNDIPGGDEHFIQINQATVQQVAEGMNTQPEPLPVRVGGSNQ